MRDYVKPFIEEEEIDIEDICETSLGTPKDNYSTDSDDDFVEI